MKYQIVNMEKMNKIRLLQVAKLDEYREEIKTLCNSVIESDGIITRLKKELNSKQDHLPQFLGSLSRDKVRLYSTCENYGGHSEYYLTIFPDLKYFIVVGREYSQERIDQVLKAVSEFGCHDWLAQQEHDLDNWQPELEIIRPGSHYTIKSQDIKTINKAIKIIVKE